MTLVRFDNDFDLDKSLAPPKPPAQMSLADQLAAKRAEMNAKT